MKKEDQGEILDVEKPVGSKKARWSGLIGAVPVTTWTKCKERVHGPGKRRELCVTRGKRQRGLGSPERMEER